MTLPLMEAQGSRPVAIRDGKPVGVAEFLGHVAAVADGLPESPYVINLCEDRYHFLVGFAASMVRGQISLLPPGRAEGDIQRVLSVYAEAYCLVDQGSGPATGVPVHRLRLETMTMDTIPRIPAEQAAVIPFTSGSTGVPRPHPRTWRALVESARRARRRFALDKDGPYPVVATVPPQHMYGFETTIMYALMAQVSVHSSRPFFPADVADVLGQADGRAILVTTPIHLRAMVESGMAWPEMDRIISATAPLPLALAKKAESTFKCPVLEIYGCTEAGSIATRRTTTDERWYLFDGYRLDIQGRRGTLHVPELPAPVPLPDFVEAATDGSFHLLGRTADLVNIAGKRASLGDLNSRLRQIDGVEDGVFVLPPAVPGRTPRLAALVVSPAGDRKRILDALARHLDPAFLPRPLVLVDELPYTDTGKLRRDDLLKLLGFSTGEASCRHA